MRLFGTNNYSSSPKSGDVQVACLRVQVISCDGLEARDKKSNTSDPFVVVSLFGKQFKTPVCYRNVNPTYEKDATFDFPIYMSLVSELGTLKFVVWDKDMFGKDYLGDYSLPVNQWFNKTAFDFTGNEPFSVNLLSSRIKNPGTMLIKIGFAPHLSTSQSDFGEIYNELIASNNVGIVTVEIIGAKNLPNWPNVTRMGFDMDPFVEVSIGKQVQRTCVIRHEQNPVWKEQLLFHVGQNDLSLPIRLTVFDKDNFSPDDLVGTLQIPIASPTEWAGLNTWSYPVGLEITDELPDFLLTKNSKKKYSLSPTIKFRAYYRSYVERQ